MARLLHIYEGMNGFSIARTLKQKDNVMRSLSPIKLRPRLSCSETRSSRCCAAGFRGLLAAASRLGALGLLAMLPTLSSGGPVSANGGSEPLAALAAPMVTAVSATSLAVAWTAPANLRSPVSKYDVRYRLARSSGGFRYADHIGTGTTVTLEGLRPDRAYKVQVRAHNDEGPSAWSALGTGRTYDNASPAFTDEGDGFESLKLDVSGPETTGDDLPTETAGQADIDADIYSLMGRNAGEFIILDDDSSGTLADASNAAGVVNGAPRFDVPTYAFALAENEVGRPTPIALGRVLARDPEGQAVTYALIGAASRFAVEATSGVLTYIGPGENAEVTEDYTLTAQAADPHGASASVEMRITISNIDEPGRVTLTAYESLIGDVVRAAVQDPDGAIADAGWQWQRSADGNVWDAIAGATQDHYTPGIDDEGQRLRAMATYTDPARTTPLAIASKATAPVAVAAADANQTSQLALAAVGRSVAEDVIEALNARMVAARNPESYLTINGQRTVVGRVEAGGANRSSRVAAQQRHPLDNSEFQLAIDETNELTLWGRGALNSFNSQTNPIAALTLNSQLGFGYLGLDYRRAGAATGVGMMLLRNQGTLDYQSTFIDKDHAALTLTNVLPYVHWQPKAGVDVWSLVGYGRGEMEVLDVDPVRLRMGAVGLRYALRSFGGVDLAAKTDAFAVQLTPEAGAGSMAQRLRLAVESRMNWRISPYGSFQPNVELGVRWDGGDGETGPGAEVAGGLTYINERYGLHVEARGRRLLAHREHHVGLWGGSLMVRRQSADLQGLQVAFGPSWGEADSQVESLWRGQLMRAGTGTPHELTLTSGYGLNLSAASQLTPFVEAGTGPMQRLRVGTRWGWTGEGTRQVEIFGEQRSAPDTPADRSIQLRGTFEL